MTTPPTPERTPEEFWNVLPYGIPRELKSSVESLFAQAIEQGRQAGLAEKKKKP